MDLVHEFENLQRHNRVERRPAALRSASRRGLCNLRSRAIALLRDEKTAIGLANSFGGFLVFLLYMVQP